MDPNETLGAIRRAIASIGDTDSDDLSESDIQDMITIVASFSALDSWLSVGGFLPRAWSDNRR